jgi:mannose-1-phosphate guanylyltransferase
MFREDNLERAQQISAVNNNLWGVVLAGGEGTRLSNFIKSLYGYHRPKQYCAITGTQSLIKHTIKRVAKIIPDSKILTVVNRDHSKYYREELHNRPEETIVVQPCPRDTSAGILLPVSKIYNTDPDSTVAIFPSDHFILEEDKFINYVKEACIFVNMNPDLIVLIGVRPDRIESGLGWIERGERIQATNNFKIHRIQKFWEKPDSIAGASLFNSGCLVNTFIIIGKTKTLIKQIAKQLPHLSRTFEPIREKMGTPMEKFAIEKFFGSLPEVNFSTDFLQKLNGSLAVMEVPDVYWSDWGEEQRVVYDIGRFNLSPFKTAEPVLNALAYHKNSSRRTRKPSIKLLKPADYYMNSSDDYDEYYPPFIKFGHRKMSYKFKP